MPGHDYDKNPCRSLPVPGVSCRCREMTDDSCRCRDDDYDPRKKIVAPPMPHFRAVTCPQGPFRTSFVFVFCLGPTCGTLCRLAPSWSAVASPDEEGGPGCRNPALENRHGCPFPRTGRVGLGCLGRVGSGVNGQGGPLSPSKSKIAFLSSDMPAGAFSDLKNSISEQ